ncbi:MAG TPA: hypothetical protein VF331_12810 [Polyangiales bacterium]
MRAEVTGVMQGERTGTDSLPGPDLCAFPIDQSALAPEISDGANLHCGSSKTCERDVQIKIVAAPMGSWPNTQRFALQFTASLTGGGLGPPQSSVVAWSKIVVRPLSPSGQNQASFCPQP